MATTRNLKSQILRFNRRLHHRRNLHPFAFTCSHVALGRPASHVGHARKHRGEMTQPRHMHATKSCTKNKVRTQPVGSHVAKHDICTRMTCLINEETQVHNCHSQKFEHSSLLLHATRSSRSVSRCPASPTRAHQINQIEMGNAESTRRHKLHALATSSQRHCKPTGTY